MKPAITTAQIEQALADQGYALTSGQWQPNVKVRTRVDLGATLIARLPYDAKILRTAQGVLYISRAGQAARIAKI